MNLINDLLDITKIEIGKISYQKEIFDFDDLIKDVVIHQKVITPNRKISLTGQTKKVIYADKYRIRQVVVNLLTNALKYSPDTKRVTLRLKSKRDSVLLSIKDFGLGIPRDELKLIFNRYYRTKSVEKKRSEGLGLGLFISNQIVKFHQGKLWVESIVGKGSTFFVSLPIERSGEKRTKKSFDNFNSKNAKRT